MTATNRLAIALEGLYPLAEGNGIVALHLASILTSIEIGDTAEALFAIHNFGDAAERNGVADQVGPLLGRLLDVHSLAVFAAL